MALRLRSSCFVCSCTSGHPGTFEWDSNLTFRGEASFSENGSQESFHSAVSGRSEAARSDEQANRPSTTTSTESTPLIDFQPAALRSPPSSPRSMSSLQRLAEDVRSLIVEKLRAPGTSVFAEHHGQINHQIFTLFPSAKKYTCACNCKWCHATFLLLADLIRLEQHEVNEYNAKVQDSQDYLDVWIRLQVEHGKLLRFTERLLGRTIVRPSIVLHPAAHGSISSSNYTTITLPASDADQTSNEASDVAYPATFTTFEIGAAPINGSTRSGRRHNNSSSSSNISPRTPVPCMKLQGPAHPLDWSRNLRGEASSSRGGCGLTQRVKAAYRSAHDRVRLALGRSLAEPSLVQDVDG